MIQKFPLIVGTNAFINETRTAYEKTLTHESLVKQTLGARFVRLFRELWQKIALRCCRVNYAKKIQGKVKNLREILADNSYVKFIERAKFDDLPMPWQADFTAWKKEILSLRTKLIVDVEKVRFGEKNAFEHCNAFVKQVRTYIDLQKKYFGSEENLRSAFLNYRAEKIVHEADRLTETIKDLKNQLLSKHNVVIVEKAFVSCFKGSLEALNAHRSSAIEIGKPLERLQKIEALWSGLAIRREEIEYGRREINSLIWLEEIQQFMADKDSVKSIGNAKQLREHANELREALDKYSDITHGLNRWINENKALKIDKNTQAHLRKRLETFEKHWTPLIEKIRGESEAAILEISAISAQGHLDDQAFIAKVVAKGFEHKKVKPNGNCLFEAVVAGIKEIDEIDPTIKQLDPIAFRKKIIDYMVENKAHYRVEIESQLMSGLCELREIKTEDAHLIEAFYKTWPKPIADAFKTLKDKKDAEIDVKLVETYLTEMQDPKIYGGENELRAVAEYLKIPIRLYTKTVGDTGYQDIHPLPYPKDDKKKALHLIRPTNTAHYDCMLPMTPSASETPTGK